MHKFQLPMGILAALALMACDADPVAPGAGAAGGLQQAGQGALGNYFHRFELKRGQRKYHDLSKPGAVRDASTERLSAPKVLADVEAFKRLVEGSLVNGFLKEDGNATDDLIDLAEAESGVVYVSTNTEAELKVVISRLEQIERSVLVHIDDDQVSAPALKSGRFVFRFHPEAGKQRVQEFKVQRGINDSRITWDEPSRSVIYDSLPEAEERELLAIWKQYNREPWQVLMEVKILSVSQDTARELGARWGYNPDGGSSFSSSANPGAGTLKVGIPLGGGSLEAEIQALEADGRAFRQKDVQKRDYEHYRDDVKPYEFVKKQVTPVRVSGEGVAALENTEVGLGLVLNKVSVIETPVFRERMDDLNARIEAWLKEPQNAAVLEKIERFYRQGKFSQIRLEDVDRILTQDEEFNYEWRKILSSLDISVEGRLEDGGAIRTFETADGPITQFEKIATTFNMLVKNKQPAFVSGTNTVEGRDRNSGYPGLRKIPLIGWLFGQQSKTTSHDSAVAFFTMTVVDDRTDRYATARYSQLGQRFAIPHELGGFAPNSSNDHPLVTGIRSELFFMNDSVGRGVLYNAMSKLPYRPQSNEWAINLFGHMFWEEIFKPIGDQGIRAEADWLNFPLIQERLNRLRQPVGYTAGHPFVEQDEGASEDHQGDERRAPEPVRAARARALQPPHGARNGPAPLRRATHAVHGISHRQGRRGAGHLRHRRRPSRVREGAEAFRREGRLPARVRLQRQDRRQGREEEKVKRQFLLLAPREIR